MLPYIGLALLFCVSMLFQVRYAQDIWHGDKVSLPLVFPETASAKLSYVSPGAAELGLHPGDVLLAVNGIKYTGTSLLAERLAKAEPGEQVELTVNSASGVQTVVLPATKVTSPWGRIVYDFLLNVVMPIFCVLLGSWVVLVRPRDMLAWLLLFLLVCFSQILSASKIESWGPGWREIAMAWHTGLVLAWPISMFLFGFFFPEPFPFWKKMGPGRQWLPWLVSAPLVIAAVPQIVVAVREMTDYAGTQNLYHAFQHFDIVLRIYAYCVIGFGFFSAIFTKSAMAISRDARRRLFLLYCGASAAMVPLLLLTFWGWIRGRALENAVPSWLIAIALLMLLLFPLTLAYVIVVQRAMDVSVVVRQGLQYGLAKNGIKVIQVLLIVAAAYFVEKILSDQKADLILRLVGVAAGATAVWRISRRADKLRGWIDRRFFRETYNAEQVLSDLSDQVRGMVETRPLIETVAERISATLHVPQVAVLLGGSGPYRPAYALGYSVPPDVTFPASNGTIKMLQAQKEPARVYPDNQDSWLYRDPRVNEEDRKKLAELHAELLLPLSARDHLLGFISLGPKRSEEPYSGTDVRLLKSVAAQTGLALENSRLMSAMAEEIAQRERLNREVEIAREVQERLFPQTLPPILGIEYAGACRPALGVGGDYYDFLALPGGQLGIAIGDVSGKGIAAALMMASLQASLRGEATRAPENLAALISNVNRLVYEASSANRYATFFYAQYNPDGRRLNYVNAGHNPPMLFHFSAGQWKLSRLETGGTVVGLLESYPYQQASLTIEPEDIFIAFTDGISEAMNSADEEWGEEQLIETIKACAGLSPSETIARVMQAADVFVAGAKQHDDMTLVVLRAKP
jgi:sigma-B regulation protein RsbU (phosphoserine phosphatase)